MSKLTVEVEQDEFTAKVAQAFDLDFDGTIETEVPDFEFPEYNSYNIGLIVGASGSGKSTILRNLVESDEEIQWEPKNTLCKPYHVLSNGEKYRAKFARLLEHDLVMDEFTSEVNRETAKSLCVCVSKYIRKKDIKNIVLASCHKDIIPWLQPDWVFDCDSGERFDNDDPVDNLNKVAKIEIY
jgi:ABC-type ATPase with predicted acetyltransferase domain